MGCQSPIQCKSGRWLAISPPESAFRVGVLAESSEAATRMLEKSLKRWLELSQLTASTHTTGEIAERQQSRT